MDITGADPDSEDEVGTKSAVKDKSVINSYIATPLDHTNLGSRWMIYLLLRLGTLIVSQKYSMIRMN